VLVPALTDVLGTRRVRRMGGVGEEQAGWKIGFGGPHALASKSVGTRMIAPPLDETPSVVSLVNLGHTAWHRRKVS